MAHLSPLPHLHSAVIAQACMSTRHHHRVRCLVTAQAAVDAVHHDADLGSIDHITPVQTTKSFVSDLLADFNIRVASSSDVSRRGRDIVGAGDLHKQTGGRLGYLKQLVQGVEVCCRSHFAIEESVPPVAEYALR